MNEAYDSIILQGADGESVSLASLWRDRPVLLFFMRQLGCGVCRRQMLSLRDYAERFAAANCAIAIIVMGDGKLAADLAGLYRLPFPVYGDQRMAAYEAFEIGETSWWNVVGPHIIARQVGTLLGGMRPMWGEGSMRQLGGLAVVGPDAQTLFYHVASPIYRYPPWDEVLAALSMAATA